MESSLVHLLQHGHFFNLSTFRSPPFCFLSHLSLLDERYQSIIQLRITKGNQDCFVRRCGCLFPLWSLPLFNSQQQPPNPRLSHDKTDAYEKHMRVTFAQWYSVVMKIWQCFVCREHEHIHGTHTSHDKAEEYEHGWGLHYGGTGAGLQNKASAISVLGPFIKRYFLWRQQQKSVRKAVRVTLDLLRFRFNSQIVTFITGMCCRVKIISALSLTVLSLFNLWLTFDN